MALAENECSIDEVADDILKLLKKAVKQSKNTVLRHKTKTVSTEYDEELKKPMTEITEEKEEIEEIKGTVDIGSLKTITGLLKEVSGMRDTTVSEEKDMGVIVLADVKDLDDE